MKAYNIHTYNNIGILYMETLAFYTCLFATTDVVELKIYTLRIICHSHSWWGWWEVIDDKFLWCLRYSTYTQDDEKIHEQIFRYASFFYSSRNSTSRNFACDYFCHLDFFSLAFSHDCFGWMNEKTGNSTANRRWRGLPRRRKEQERGKTLMILW